MNPTSNVILERIHMVLGNIVWLYKIHMNYINEDEPWIGILGETAFETISIQIIIKVYTTGQLVFIYYMIIPTKKIADRD